MGQATYRKKRHQRALEHLKQFGTEQSPLESAEQRAQSPSATWLQENFVRSLLPATNEGEHSWHNRLYLEALRHPDPCVRRGITAVMNTVLTAGLEPGRVVFALLADVHLDRPEVLGEFDTCESLAVWVCNQLKVPRHNLRIRHSAMVVPARAGLFGLIPALSLVTQIKPLGTQPNVGTRKVSRESQKRQTLLFLVSVFTDRELELDSLTTGHTSLSALPLPAPAAGSAATATATPAPVSVPVPIFKLPYWGLGEEAPDSLATVVPLRAMLAFDGLLMLGFWDALNELEAALAPWLELAVERAGGIGEGLPVLQVSECQSLDSRFVKGTGLFVRFKALAPTEMPEILAYQGSYADDFVHQLERLGVVVERISGIRPALVDVALFAPDGEWAHLA